MQLLNHYFTNSKQVVYINHTYSGQQDVSCVVPQGSVLGLLLFTTYVNDQSKISKFETRLFADDTQLILSDKNIKSLNVKVDSELIKVEQWLHANKLSLNYSKTKYFLIKPFAKVSYTDEYSVSIRGIQLGNCHLAKHLGVIIDENLNWKPYVLYLQKKLFAAAGIIAKMHYYLKEKNLVALYYVFSIRISCMEYLVGKCK